MFRLYSGLSSIVRTQIKKENVMLPIELIHSKKNQSFPIAKLGSRKTQKIAYPQN